MKSKILDRLIARSITDGTFRGRFERGRLMQDLDELGASKEARAILGGIPATSWEDFVGQAYRRLHEIEARLEIPQMPSALDGLRPVHVIDEQVA